MPSIGHFPLPLLCLMVTTRGGEVLNRSCSRASANPFDVQFGQKFFLTRRSPGDVNRSWSTLRPLLRSEAKEVVEQTQRTMCVGFQPPHRGSSQSLSSMVPAKRKHGVAEAGGVWCQRPVPNTRAQRIAATRRRAADQKIGGISILATMSTTPDVRKDYVQRLIKFRAWYLEGSPAMTWERLVCTPAALQQVLLEYFDYLYLTEQRDVSYGTKLLAAVGGLFPAYHRAGRRDLFPTVNRALQGWQKAHPVGTRLPMPMLMVYAVAMEMAARQQLDLARLTVVAADCYLRPGEAASLTSDMVIPSQRRLGAAYGHVSLQIHPAAQGRPSKTGEFDDTIVVDSVSRPWLSQVLMALKTKAGPGQPLVLTTLAAWGRLFAECCADLGEESQGLYVLRHSGPSDDYLRHARTLLGIKKRGRWTQDSSIRRYEKSAKTMSAMTHWTPQMKAHLRKCEALIGDVLLGKKLPSAYKGPLVRKSLKRP